MFASDDLVSLPPDFCFHGGLSLEALASDSSSFQRPTEDMKARGLASPDLGDCLAMTFPVTVQQKKRYEMDSEEVDYLRRVRNGGGVWA